MSFRRFEKTTLYLGNTSTPSTQRCGILLPLDTTSPPETFDLTGALAHPDATFVLFPGLPSGEKALANAITAMAVYLSDASRTNVRLAWFPDPQAAPIRAFVMRLERIDGRWISVDRNACSLSNLALRFTKGNVIGVDADGCGLEFTPKAGTQNKLTVTPRGVAPESFMTASSPIRLPLLAEEDFPNGAFCFDIMVSQKDMEDLDAGLRYFLTSKDYPGYVDSLRYPVFDLMPIHNHDADKVNLACRLDPLAPLDHSRTCFEFTPDTAMRSYLRSPNGDCLYLTPLPGAKLVLGTNLQVAPGKNSVDFLSVQSPYYLAPAGSFKISVPPDKIDNKSANNNGLTRAMMCGLSGVEYIAFRDDEDTILTWTPDCPAYGPTLYPESMSGNNPAVHINDLTKDAKTSWAFVSGATQILSYYAQPDSSVLFTLSGNNASADPYGFLDYLPLISGCLQPQNMENCFPLVPFAGLGASANPLCIHLERQIFNPQRRSIISKQSPTVGSVYPACPNDNNLTETGTTPQGLLLSIDDEKWAQLDLATYPSNSQSKQLSLFNVDGMLRQSLQSNQVFLVISNGSSLLECCSIPYLINHNVIDRLKLVENVPEDVLTLLKDLVNKRFTVLEDFETALVRVLVPYLLTPEILNAMKTAQQLPQTVIDALKDAQVTGSTYNNFVDFDSALRKALSPTDYRSWGEPLAKAGSKFYTQYNRAIIQEAADFSLEMAGFTFDLSPWRWDQYGTILIFKFVNQSLAHLVNNTSSWSNPDAFNTGVETIQQKLQGIIGNIDKSDPDFDYFGKLVDNPNWNGIFALNCRIPFTELPKEMEGLAAGIKPDGFTAHHVGINVTPIHATSGNMTSGNSSLFGLINYSASSDSADQINDSQAAAGAGDGLAVSSSGPKGSASNDSNIYKYTVETLKVLLANSTVARFSSTSLLTIKALFGDFARLINGRKGIRYNGYYIKQGDSGSYVFLSDDLNVFSITSRTLDKVEIGRSQLVTVQNKPGNQETPDMVCTRFELDGKMCFKQLDGFDGFSFGHASAGNGDSGGLNFSGLRIEMAFNSKIPTYQTFTFDPTYMVFDVNPGSSRPKSLFKNFPLKLKRMDCHLSSPRPDSGGTLPINVPLSSQGLSDTWFALVSEINLGSLGSLAASADFTATMTAAWSPSPTEVSVYFGLSLPGVKNGNLSFALQGVLKLAFGAVNFLVNDTSYILQLQNIALKLLGLSFPPGGQINMMIFGDPKGQDQNTLAWYASYLKEGADQSSPNGLLSNVLADSRFNNVRPARPMHLPPPRDEKGK